ncbi:Quinone oxidoreductase [Caenispirillum salinarum AK4]|uniref:Quinone oxidoreductase n=1 Tax=Caenispirillum salinarum AK4 TaxID=1238182 RepID=K9GSD3_9PROT|nr:NAD(P)H-quinone oxidoreductase [Caenispirillum salinarum]EKV27629.1 Quinone oxidoreductase [Caenispirillum salinarum AK4]
MSDAPAIPSSMTYIRLTEYGPAENLVPAEGPVPSPAPGQVLIKVAAAGVNRPDVLQRQGNYPPPAGASDVLGLEVAGTVVKLGDGVERFKVGDSVCALVVSDGYSQYVVAPEPQVLPVPTGLSLQQAAALPETYFTVWSNIFDRGRLKEGETILIHGGSSGIGTTAVQLAKAFGATVIVTAGTDDKCAACKDLGADHAINYQSDAFEDKVSKYTEGRGADVILDMVGGAYVPRNLSALADDGRLVQIAFLDSADISGNFLQLMTRRLTWTGSTLRPRTVDDKGRIAKALEANVWPLLSKGTVRPIIHATYPLEEAAKAHKLMESSSHIGKIMLEVTHPEPGPDEEGDAASAEG